MLYKTIHTGSYDFGIQPVSLVDIHSRGVDKSWMQKRAAALGTEASQIQAEPGRSVLHIIAMGSTQDYGPNRNADGFTRGTLRSRHNTFVKNGHVYKHHKNKDPQKASGEVKSSAFNEPMKRVELLIGVDEDKWATELEKVANGEDVPFSMACRVPFDSCSICGNRAPTREDYCFLPGTEVTMSDGTRKPIEQVVSGDIVIGADGCPTEVLQTFVRDVRESVYKLDTSMQGLELVCTGNHPIYSSPYENNVCPFVRQEPQTRNPTCVPGCRSDCETCRKFLAKFDYVRADSIRQGDCLFAPRLQELVGGCPDGEEIGEEGAWVFGLFMAKGSYQKYRYKQKKSGEDIFYYSGINFSLGKEDEDRGYVERLRRYFSRRYGKDIKVYRSKTADNLSVRVHSKAIATEWKDLLSEYAKHKKIGTTLLSRLTLQTLHSFIGGLLAGDGHTQLSDNRLNSASYALVCQVCEAAKLLGYSAYIGKPVVVPGGPTNRTNKCDQWYVIIEGWEGGETGREIRMNHRMRWATDTGMAGYVRSIETYNYCGPVHNIETEDGSYIAGGLVVHNCDHMKKMAGQILSDGRQVYVDNPNPTFFDISGVFRPADRIAYHLQKVASQAVMTGADLAELDGLIPADSSAPPARRSQNTWRKRAMLRKLAAIEKEIEAIAPGNSGWASDLKGSFSPELKGVSDGELDSLSEATRDRIDKLMGALGQVQISLPLRDFVRIVMGNETGGISLSDIEKHLPGVFSRILDEEDDDAICDGAYDPMGGLADLPSGVKGLIDKMVPGMSLAEGPVQKRTITVIARKIPKPTLTPGSGIHTIKVGADDTGTELLAREYAKYKLSFLADAMEKQSSELLVRLGVLQNYLV